MSMKNVFRDMLIKYVWSNGWSLYIVVHRIHYDMAWNKMVRENKHLQDEQWACIKVFRDMLMKYGEIWTALKCIRISYYIVVRQIHYIMA